MQFRSPRALLLLIVAALGCGQSARDSESVNSEAVPAEHSSLVRLTETQRGELSVDTVHVRRSAGTIALEVPGEVMPSPDNFAVVSAPIGGRVVSIGVHEGERVRKGQVIVEVESVAFAEMAANYLEARADESYFRAQVTRTDTLVGRGISPRAALEKAEAELARAEARASAAYSRLRALNLPAERMESWQTAMRERPLLPIFAPISGVVDEHGIDLGASVTEYQEMMTIIDARRVLVRAFLAPNDAQLVRTGTPVRIAGSPAGGTIEARVTSVSPALDEENKSIVVYILLPTKNEWPVPGQTIQIMIDVPSDTEAIAVPLDAVFYDGDDASVFVWTTPMSYDARHIDVARVTETHAFVAEGLVEGEAVAVSDVFSLKALARFGEFAE